MRAHHLLAALALLAACAPRAVVDTATTLAYAPPPPSGAPFSPAVRVNGLIFLAGKLGTDASGKLAPGGVQAETRQALQNIRAELERQGGSMDRMVKCTVLLADIAEWGAMNEAYAPFFPGNKPARTAVAVRGLPLDARVEIECIAAA